MGCNCGKPAGSSKVTNVAPALTATQLRKKLLPYLPVTQTKPSTILNMPSSPSRSMTLDIFKRLSSKLNPLIYKASMKTIILITKEGNAEGKYLKNLLSKFAVIRSEYQKSMEFLEIESSYLINPQDFTAFPTTIFITPNSVFKVATRLYDVPGALNEFYQLKQ